jgi:hypothetical protein
MKIAIIENQITHFKDVCQKLRSCENDLEIVPTEDDYLTITNWARIYLDTRYEKTKRKNAQAKLKNFIEKENPALMVVDHILLGFTLDKNKNPDGITLITDLWIVSQAIKRIPVLFLSSSLYNDPTVTKRIQGINENHDIKIKPDWKNKKLSIFQEPIGDISYFEETIVPAIKKLVNMSISLRKGGVLAGKLEELHTRFSRANNNSDIYQPEKKYKEIIEYCRSDQPDNEVLDTIETLTENIRKNFPISCDVGFTAEALNAIARTIMAFSIPTIDNTDNV